jgi:UDP-2-acetamido-3-amino-2,3-dideoxy-glucuronate N-acetyltransferase
MVGHLLWYHPAVLKLKQLIDNGELGKIRYIYSQRLNLGRIRSEENILWSFAPHDISLILGLTGAQPHAVSAHGGSYLNKRVEDVTVSFLEFADGLRAHIFVSWLHPFKEQKLVVVGERKMAVFDDLRDEKLLLYPHAIEWREQIPIANRAPAEVVDLETYEPLRAECGHFLECLQTRATPRTDANEAVRVLEVLERCEQSLRSMDGKSYHPGCSVHESAFIDESVTIGDGTTIWHVSHLLRGTRVGRNCRIGQNVVIGPHVTIGDGVKIQNNVSIYEGITLEDATFVGPSVVFTNVINPRAEIPRMDELLPTRVRRGASLGANATILCGLTIGSYAMVGAGAVVTRDVPDFALVTGNPARWKAWVCSCGVKLVGREKNWHCPDCGRQYHKADGRLSAAEAIPHSGQ